MTIKKQIQQSLLQDNELLFQMFLFGLGGICLKSQFDRFANRGDHEQYLRAGLLRKQRLGRNIVYLATKPVLEYFNVNSAVRYTTQRLIKSSLLAEMYYNQFHSNIRKINKAISTSNMAFFTPTVHVDFMEDAIRLFEQYRLDTTSLRWEADRLLQRAEDAAGHRVGARKKGIIHKTGREDLFTLAAKNIYVADAQYDPSKGIFHVHAIILDIKNLSNRELTRRIELATQAMEDIFCSVPVIASVEVHTHRQMEPEMKRNILNSVMKSPCYKTRDDLFVRSTIWMCGYNSYQRLFSGINIDNLL